MSSRAKTTSAAPRNSSSGTTPASGGDERPTLVDRQGFAVGCDDTGCDGYVWKYLQAELAATHRIVHWHYRGHGRTPMPRNPRRVDITDLADDLAAVLDAAVGDGAGAVVAGHSMGVQVCLEFYRRHRDRVKGLVLMCGSYGTPLRTFKGKRTLEQVLPFVKFLVDRIPGTVARVWSSLIPTELAYQIATRFE